MTVMHDHKTSLVDLINPMPVVPRVNDRSTLPLDVKPYIIAPHVCTVKFVAMASVEWNIAV